MATTKKAKKAATKKKATKKKKATPKKAAPKKAAPKKKGSVILFSKARKEELIYAKGKKVKFVDGQFDPSGHKDEAAILDVAERCHNITIVELPA